MRLPLRSFGVYVATTILTIAMFIVLHLVGNRLPLDLAVQRMADEFRAAPSGYWGMRGGRDDSYHYCESSANVVAGARAAPDNVGDALHNAIMLPTLFAGNCDMLKAAVLEGVWLKVNASANVRHWLGGKALYAIALRHLTVHEFHLAIKVFIYCGFVLLGLALFRIGWRALVVGAPLLVFGVFSSAVEQYFNLADGLPWAWALFAPALGVLLLKRDSSASTVRVFFFFAGMVSHYFWFLDGSNYLAATLIGLVVWLACEQHPPRQRVRHAASCVGVYTAGFAVSLAARVVIASPMVANASYNFWVYPGGVLARVFRPTTRDLAGRDFSTFQTLTGTDAPTFEWFLLTAAGALVTAALVAVHHALRRKPALLFEWLWLAALLLPSCFHFLSPGDDPNRAVRLMFLPLAICWCCLLAVLTKFEPRRAAICVGGVGAAAALLYAGTHLASHWQYEAKLRDARLLSAADEEAAFAVYLLQPPAGDHSADLDRGKTVRELIHWRSPCSGEDLETAEGRKKAFFVHWLVPKDADRPYGFVNAGFSFYAHGQKFFGTCRASVPVPDYARGVRTGQFSHDSTGLVFWQREISFSD